jgi:hypothetical protein
MNGLRSGNMQESAQDAIGHIIINKNKVVGFINGYSTIKTVVKQIVL